MGRDINLLSNSKKESLFANSWGIMQSGIIVFDNLNLHLLRNKGVSNVSIRVYYSRGVGRVRDAVMAIED